MLKVMDVVGCKSLALVIVVVTAKCESRKWVFVLLTLADSLRGGRHNCVDSYKLHISLLLDT